MRRIIDRIKKEEVMNRLLSLLALAAAAFLFLAATPETPPPATPIDLRIEVSPTSYGPYELLREQHPDTYTCSAMLLGDQNRRIDGFVKVVVHPGEELTKTAVDGRLKMTIKGRVDAARTGAVADVTVARDGVLIAHQQSRVNLSRTGRSQFY
jgi:hypothetical protein